MMSARTLRIVRWVQFAGLLACIGDLVYAMQGGDPDGIAILAAVFAVAWSVLICGQTWLIRHRVELERPRPTPCYCNYCRGRAGVHGAEPVRPVTTQTGEPQ